MEDTTAGPPKVRLTIYRGGHDPERVRKTLDSGVLAKMLAKYQHKLLSGQTEFNREPGYIFVLLGACAMTLGCTIPTRFKDTMTKVYMCVGLPEDAVIQMYKALRDLSGFKDGEPYNFNSMGLIHAPDLEMEYAMPGKPDLADLAAFVGINVAGPGTMLYKPPKGSTKGLNELKAKFKADELYGKEVCGGCGAAEGEVGTALLSCGQCKTRRYCGKECQKQQWNIHKKSCKAPESEEGKKEKSDGGV